MSLGRAMTGTWNALLRRTGCRRPATALLTEDVEAPSTIANLHVAQPRIEPGSTLMAMAELNPRLAASYAAAVVRDLRRCVAVCAIARPDTPPALAFEQLHALKNALAPTGSTALFHACDRLGKDIAHGGDRKALEERFKAIATSAALLVERHEKDCACPKPAS